MELQTDKIDNLEQIARQRIKESPLTKILEQFRAKENADNQSSRTTTKIRESTSGF